MTRYERRRWAALAVWTLAFLLLCWAVYGCTPIATQTIDVSQLPKEHALVVDARPCQGLYACWPWVSPHKLDIYRDAAGHVRVMPEASNGQGLDVLTSPVEGAVSHFQWGVNP